MPPRPSLTEIFLVALRLGCTAFGGPVAHLAYFREEYVRRRHWLDESDYADLVALCQFLPGPASSQTGFGIGYLQRGLAGGLAAWLGFTLPSTVLMIAFAYGVSTWGTLAHSGWLRGLKVAAVAVVAQAVWSMGKKLCPDWPRRALAAAIAAIVLWQPFAGTQMAAIALGAALGWLCFRSLPRDQPQFPQSQKPAASIGRRSSRFPGVAWLAIFFVLLVASPVLTHFTANRWLGIFDRFYRTGALVFGGGHAVLPLLEREVVAPGWLTHDQFLAGYGAVQAMPGPLFTLSAYVGTVMNDGTPLSAGPGSEAWLRGAWALIAIFLPGLLLVAGTLPLWRTLRHKADAQAALAGANAAVVGILLAALYNPVWIAGIPNRIAFVFALLAFGALQSGKIPVWLLVALAAAAGELWL